MREALAFAACSCPSPLLTEPPAGCTARETRGPQILRDLFPLHLTASTGAVVDLVVRASDLYVVGWYLPVQNVFWALDDMPAPQYRPHPYTARLAVGFDGNHTTPTRESVGLARSGVNQAVIDLADATMSPLNVQRAARALLILVQDTSEAGRPLREDRGPGRRRLDGHTQAAPVHHDTRTTAGPT
ncbi:ribosome-inactivating family protein [Kitasatospora sp. NPDC015120]|uniref:ribosome-inactivating family protein n=1 Tax=Kitasatospora sp. NPDC015120 TaxID=3364023 RepID=UPI0036F48B97